MTSKSELLTHFKTLMNKWFPLTTEMNTALGNKEDTTNKRKSTDGWSSTTNDTRYPSEKLVKDSLDGKAPTSHTSSNGATYGAASTDVYGHVKLSTSTSSTSTSLAATASAVKSAYDKGNHNHPYEPSGAVSTHNSSTSHYKYTITSSNYNPSIDSTDTTIKVKVTDVNGTAVSGVSVTVTCSAGKFANNTTTYTATTNSSGEISTTYKATEWGIINFSTNNFNCQVKVKGYKLMETVDTNNLTIKVYSDGIRVMYAVTGTTTIISGILTNKVTYKPLSNVTFELNPSQNMGARLRIAPDGGMQYYNNTGSTTSVEAQSSAIAFLATPLY